VNRRTRRSEHHGERQLAKRYVEMAVEADAAEKKLQAKSGAFYDVEEMEFRGPPLVPPPPGLPCKHCGMNKRDHAEGKKCLFEPTKYSADHTAPSTPAEDWYMDDGWEGFDSDADY
jgi:hypothetical protein